MNIKFIYAISSLFFIHDSFAAELPSNYFTRAEELQWKDLTDQITLSDAKTKKDNTKNNINDKQQLTKAKSPSNPNTIDTVNKNINKPDIIETLTSESSLNKTKLPNRKKILTKDPLQSKIKANIYIFDINSKAKDGFNLLPANTNKQPYKNIKSSLEEIYQDTLIDFNASLPILRQTVKDAAEAVGYYQVKVSFGQIKGKKSHEELDIIIESTGNPVIIDNRVIDIRGEGKSLPEFKKVKQNLPKEGERFDHSEYQNTKNMINLKSNEMGFFDAKWLNKSADIILPDNTADVDLIYDTGTRYKFGEVVFFTLDEQTGQLTTDPDKLPIKPQLLKQILGFKEGDGYFSHKINKLRNDLSATRFFNRINVESVLPKTEEESNDILFEDLSESEDTNTTKNKPNIQNNDTDTNDNKNIDIALVAFPQGLEGGIQNLSIANIKNTKQNANEKKNNQNPKSDNALKFDGTADSILNQLINESINDAITHNNEMDEQLASIIFKVNESTNDKYKAIKHKADSLLLMPDDRVLNEVAPVARSPLGKISNAISSIAKTMLPDETDKLTENSIPDIQNKKTPNQVKQDKKIPLYIFVASNKPYDAQIGLGYGTDTGFRTTAKLDNNLVNNDGYQTGISAEWSKVEKKLSLRASKPWKHPLDDRLNAGLSYEEKVINKNNNNDWSTESTLASVSRNKYSESGWNRNYSLRYRYDRLDLGTDIEADPNKLPVKFSSSKPKQQALLLGYSLSKTSVDNLANPTIGFKQTYSLETAMRSALSDTDMAILRVGLSGIYSFKDKHQIIGKLNTGYLWANDFNDVPYTLRFFAGGDQSIRGYDYNSLSPIDGKYLTGGQILGVISSEYNYEFKEGLRGAIFSDIGNAYDKNLKTPTKLGLGFGIRWASPVGPIRLDVGAGVTEKSIPVRLHLFIGSPL